MVETKKKNLEKKKEIMAELNKEKIQKKEKINIIDNLFD